MVISGSYNRRNIQFEIKGLVPKVLTCSYAPDSGSLVYSQNKKNDSAVAASAFETSNELSIDGHIFVKKKADHYQIPPNEQHLDRY